MLVEEDVDLAELDDHGSGEKEAEDGALGMFEDDQNHESASSDSSEEGEPLGDLTPMQRFERMKIPDDKKFKIDTLGGDASLLHLIGQIDRGIKRKLKEKGGARANLYRTWHRVLMPLKYFILLVYILLVLFERPAWCNTMIYGKEPAKSKADAPEEWKEYE